MGVIDGLRKLARAAVILLGGCSPTMPKDVMPSKLSHDGILNQPLAKLFRSHHIAAEERGEWVVFPDYPLKASAAIVQEWKATPAVVSVQLDVRLLLGPDRLLIESFGGFGKSRDQAITDALHNFIESSFHVLLAAFFVPQDDQVTAEEWVIAGTPRRAVIGNMSMRGMGGKAPDSFQPLIEWFPQVERKLKAMPLSAGTHWVRIYYAQMNQKMSELEVLLDNDEWGDLKQQLSDTAWPKGKDFFSVRVFLVIKDK